MDPSPGYPATRQASTDAVSQAIEQSRPILRLNDNWDGEGARGYSLETWSRATNFLRLLARYVEVAAGRNIPVPTIAPADQGSVDLFWKYDGRDLLVNFPAAEDEVVTFFGQSGAGESIQGTTVATGLRPDIAAWLQEE